MKPDFGNIMKQAQQMQSNIEKAQKEIAEIEIIGEAGAGMVKVTMNGRHDVRHVEIDPELMKDSKEIIEDLLAAAVNDANRRVEKMTKERMSGVTSEMGLPAGMKLPF